MKKFIAGLILAVVAVLSCSAGIAVFADGADAPQGWEKRLVSGDTATYTMQEDTIVASGNHDRMRNVLLNVSEELYGDYSVSVTVQGSKAPPYADNTDYQLGLVPWYIDDNNYVIAYMEWGADSGRPQEMRCVQITGRINGKLLANRNGNFVEWTDLWQDGNTTAENSEIEFKVTKTRSASGGGDVFTAYINGMSAASTQLVEFRDTVMYDAVPAYAGIYAFSLDDDTAVFSGYSVTQEERVDSYRKIGSTQSVGRTADGSLWTEADGAYSVSSAGGNALSDAVALVASYGTDHTVSADVAMGAAQGDRGVGLVGWYQDEYNYLIGGVKQVGGTWYAGFEGEISSLEEKGSKYVLTKQHIDTFAPTEEDLSSLRSLRIMKSGSYMILYATGAEGEMQLASYRNAALYTEGKVGYAAFGCTASFGAVTRGDASYVAYDWYEENGYFVRAAQKGAVAIGSDGSIVFGENAVTAGDDTLFAAAYRPSGYYDMLTTSAVFGTEAQPVGEEAVYGIYGWIQDGEQYLAVYVSADGVTVENHFAQDSFSETYALPSGFVFAGSKTLTVGVACDGAVSVALSDGSGTYPVVGEGTDVAFLMRGHDREAAIGSGVLVGGAPVTVTGFSAEGYEPYSTRQEGEWSLRGPRYSTWDIAQDGTITARGGAAEDALRTVALVPHGQKDFYFGTRIRVMAMAEGENKAGLVPYYLDENNYLFVWLDQWSGSASAVNIAGKLGGVPYTNGLGEDWNAYYVDYRYLGAAIELEVQISGDMLYIYLNRQFAPVVALELEGFGERPLEGAAAGVSVLHSDAAFAEGIRFGTERIFRAEEKPTVHMNGRLAEEAALGEQVALPDFSAVSADGQTLAPDVAVTDPSGGTVDVSGNAFTADKEGVYTVTVTAADVWGNHADPLILQVAVQGAAPVRTLHALTQEQTAVRTGEMVILPLYADETGAEIAVVYSVTAPDGSAVAVTENAFRAEQEGEYSVAVSAENAEGLTFTVVAEKAEPAQPEPVWIALCFAIPVLLVAAATIVFCGKRSLPKGK